MELNDQLVLVTTAHRGVFAGYCADFNPDTKIIHLRSGRNVRYWTADLRGFVGLATYGPTPECKIGPAADMILFDVTAVVRCEPEAATRWESIE